MSFWGGPEGGKHAERGSGRPHDLPPTIALVLFGVFRNLAKFQRQCTVTTIANARAFSSVKRYHNAYF